MCDNFCPELIETISKTNKKVRTYSTFSAANIESIANNL